MSTYGLFDIDAKDGFYHSDAGLNYSYLFYYERKFFNYAYRDSKREWMSRNWSKSLYYAFAYIVVIFALKRIMKNRERFDLRGALVGWNLALAVFSALGAIRVWPEFIHAVSNYGVEYSVCNNSFTHGVSGCWAWMFILSKVPELIDTIFIVLRKQPLIFLHWYHHATVLVYCWFSCRDFSASGRWFVVMNYTVHAFMYGYYAFRAMRFKIPKFVNITITFGQMSQMVFGIYVNVTAYLVKKRGEKCQVSDENITWSFIMYASYFVLFFHFFYKAYIAPKSVKKHEQNGKATLLSDEKPKANGSLANHHDSNNNSIDAKKRLNGTVVNKKVD